MIPVIDLVASVRYGLRDMYGTRVSDFEIITLINQAVGILFGRLNERDVRAAMKNRQILIEDGETSYELPTDFVRIHQLGLGDGEITIPSSYEVMEGTYRIIGSTLYAEPGTYELEYYYVPAKVKKLSDTLDAPLSLSPYIERIALQLYQGRNLAEAERLAESCTHNLSEGELSRFVNTGPAMVIGATGGE